MIKQLTVLAAVTLAPSLSAQETQVVPDLPNLTLEQKTALRCSVAFALVHNGQKAGDAYLQDYAELGERGLEFAVQATAQLMDEAGVDREGLSLLVNREAEELRGNPQAVRDVMPACVMLLDASGL